VIKTKEDLLNTHGTFTWCWGMEFVVEVGDQIFIWKDPDYDGDNSFVEFDGNYEDAVASLNIDYGRDKGIKNIRQYCGEDIDVIFLGEKV
jgi:hypothetical protein